MLKYILSLHLLILSLSTSAVAATAADRIQLALDSTQQVLDKTLLETKGYSDIDRTAALSKAGFRVSVFRLQSLGRIYSYHQDKDISEFATKLRKKSKAIEDLIGQWDMYTTVHKEHEALIAAKKVINSLNEDKWVKKNSSGELFEDLQRKIKKINWPSDEKDRDFVIDVLTGHIESIMKTDYNMSLLQAGMHEIRRELRWFLIYSLVLDGVIQKSNSGSLSCPLRKLEFKDYVDAKYANLKSDPSVKNFCPISACVYDEIVGAVDVFGKLKDKAEEVVEKDQRMLDEDINPSPFKEKSDYFYNALRSNKILEVTRQQLLNCR